jgi:hypothetical protein
MKLPEQVSQFGLVGERKALALLVLGFYATVFMIMGLIAMSQLPEWTACFFGLSVCYGVGFFAVAADWFWGRWFAIGLGNSGLMMAIMSVVATREVIPSMVVFGAMHAVVSLCLLGEKMAGVYEARTDWRAKWNLDDQGVIRVKHSVSRAAASLPSLILWALAPREGAALAVLALTAVGLFGMLRGRTWGVLAIAGAGVASIASALGASGQYFYSMDLSSPYMTGVPAQAFGFASGALLLLAAVPFLRPMARFVRSA